MRRTIATLCVALFTVVNSNVMGGQERMRYSVLAIEYVGESDKPFTPIVISDSRTGAEWFRSNVLKRGDLEFTSMYVVSAPLLKSLISGAEMYRPNTQSKSESSRKSSNTVRITINKLQDEERFELDSKTASTMLATLIRACRNEEALGADLLYFKKRLVP
jgi:hypothetical protein